MCIFLAQEMMPMQKPQRAFIRKIQSCNEMNAGIIKCDYTQHFGCKWKRFSILEVDYLGEQAESCLFFSFAAASIM
jgi:hypothetical protein